MRKSRILTFLIAFSSMSLASCVYNNGVPMEVTSEVKVTLDTDSLEVKPKDGGKTFTPTVSSEEVEIKNNKVSISLNNSNVSVDAKEVESGQQVRVKGLKVGKSTITVTSLQDKNAKATLKVQVVEGGAVVVDVSGLDVESNEVNLKVGETMQFVEKASDTDETLYYEVKPEDASNKDVVFSKDTSESFSFDETGLITGLKKGSGKAVITTKSKGFKQEITVNVSEDETLTNNAIYLVGSGDTYGNWSPIKAMEFKRNEGNTKEEEYMVTFTGKAGDEVKAKRYTETNPDSADNWFEIDSSYAHEFEANAEISSGNLKLKKDTIYTIYLNLSKKNGNQYKYYVGLGS